MQKSLDLEPPCPGYDACPVALCGCRFLGTGMPWSESDSGGNHDKGAIKSGISGTVVEDQQ